VSNDYVEVHLREYDSLRREIETRATLSSSLIALELSALGVGLLAAPNFVDLYAGLGFLTVVLWLFWLDHTEQIWKLATYIAIRLRPALATVHSSALGWEPFLRELDARPLIRSTTYVAMYITLMYASVPPLFVTVYIINALKGQPELVMGVRLVSAVAIVAFWAFALHQFRQFTRSRNQMDAWISDPESF
jgi:hypothetical protein